MTKRVRILPALLVLCMLTAVASAADGGAHAAASPTHRAMMLVIQLGVIILAAKLGNLFVEKIKLPGVLGELMAGVVIGPYALGRIGFYGFPHGLFEASGAVGVSPELFGLSSVAAIVLLFYVGLETNLSLLRRFALAGGLVGLGGVLASFLLGMTAAWALGPMITGEPVGFFSPTALFLGVVSCATSVGITARILSERRQLDSPEGVTILSAAVIDDVLGIVLLAVVMGIVAAGRSAGGVNWAHVGIVGAKALGIWLLATVLGLAVSRRISGVLKWFGERTTIAIMALCLALIVGGLFEEAGLAMIIGAYVMGLSLSQTDINRVIRDKLDPVYEFLVPIFFCVTGMMIDLSASLDPAVLLFGGLYTVTALLAKLLGCGLPAMLAGFNLRGATRVGMGMAPRGEVGLIIAGIGLSTGLIGAPLFAAVIMMVVVNTLLAPPALVALFRNDAPGTRRAPGERTAEAQLRFDFPSMEMTEFFVGKLADVFEHDGFFVHSLSHDPPIYQLRKDETVIDYRQEGTELLFDCPRRAVPLVNTAVYETVAAMERAVKGLRKPLDRQDIGARLQDAGPLGPESLSLKDYLTPGLVKPRLEGATKPEVIDELLDLLVRDGKIRDADAARKAVWEREESMSTGLQYGVAIPHGKTDAVDGLVCAVGLKPEGIDFEAMDGQPSRIFILTLSPKSTPAPHVQFMSTVSQVLNSAGRERILRSRTARQIHQAFTAPPRKKLPEPAPPAATAERPAGPFQVADYLSPERVKPDLAGTTGEEIIRELIDLLAERGQVADPEAAAEAVLAREASMSTGMEKGVAVPHGRTNAVDRLVCAVGVKKEGIDFGAADGKPSRIFVLVVTPEDGADPYLQFVAALMGLLDENGRRAALTAETPGELYRALTGGSR